MYKRKAILCSIQFTGKATATETGDDDNIGVGIEVAVLSPESCQDSSNNNCSDSIFETSSDNV